MIAIIDGGSTKCDWVILEDSGSLHLKTTTLGFNPNIINPDFIAAEINRNADLAALVPVINQVFFYGSGCGVAANADKVKKEFLQIFNGADIEVKDDMIAAAYAAYTGRPGLVCILGTGSNSCFFDGENIRVDLPSLGFLIGDEGSGSALGKHLLRRFFMKKLPADLEQAFRKKYELTIEQTLQSMYHNPRANAYLGSFNEFIAEHKNHSYFQNMVFDEMKNFMDFHILPYPEAREVEINFIGYIAFIYEDILRAAAAELNLTVGRIVQKPIESLVDYHKKYLLQLS